MVEIRVLVSTTVRPATSIGDSPPRKIELTPWDLQFLLLRPIQKGLLFQSKQEQSKQHADSSTMIDHLKASLSRALDFFPPLAGRFISEKNEEDDTATFSVECNAAGVEFVHAVVDDLSVSDLLEQLYLPRIFDSFFPCNGLRNHEGVSKPIFGVQITELVDGFFMGFTMNHSIGDGASFWHFINSWSEFSCGMESITKPPDFNRWFPDETKVPVRIPSWEEEVKQSLNNMSNISSQVHLQERVFHFSKRNITQLKAKANDEMKTEEQISSLQSLVAHLWRSITRCCEIEASEEVDLLVTVGARQRLKSILPDGYFGNAIQIITITVTAGELLKNGLGWAALQVNKAIVEQTKEELTNFYENWLIEPKLRSGRKISAKKRVRLVLSSSPRFNMYENDFGWGKPIAVRSGVGNKSDGMVTFFGGAVEDGSIDVGICLTPETMDGLVTNDEFMDAVNRMHT